MTIGNSTRDRLLEMLRGRSIRKGPVDLSSGGKSNYYVDTRETTFTPTGLLMTAAVFVAKFKELGLDPEGIGGMELGAAPIVSGIVLYSAVSSHTRALKGFLVRRQPKKYGMKRTIEGTLLRSKSPVIIVDDVCTTGNSLRMAVFAAKEMDWNVLAAISLVDRQQDKDIGDTQFFSIFTSSDLIP